MTILYGIKNRSMQIWDEQGKRYLATVVKSDPMVVSQIKSKQSDGYEAVQCLIGQRTSTLNKPLGGHLAKANILKKPKFVREILIENTHDLKVGDLVHAKDVIEPGDIVSVSGTTKGRGFSGVVKRWGFAGGPKTHGQSDRQRAPGSIGQGTTPGRVHKGKKMPGRYGNATLTVKNLSVLNVDDTNNEVWISGTVPGAYGSLIKIEKKFSGTPIVLRLMTNQEEVKEMAVKDEEVKNVGLDVEEISEDVKKSHEKLVEVKKDEEEKVKTSKIEEEVKKDK